MTNELTDFIIGLEHDEAQAKSILRDMLSKTWFGETTIKLLSIEPVKEEDLISKLGMKAKVPKEYNPRIKRLLDWMQYSGLININKEGIVSLAEPVQKVVTKKEEKTIKLEHEEIKVKEIPLQVTIHYVA